MSTRAQRAPLLIHPFIVRQVYLGRYEKQHYGLAELRLSPYSKGLMEPDCADHAQSTRYLSNDWRVLCHFATNC